MRETLTFPIIPRRRLVSSGFGDHPGERRGSGYDFVAMRRYVPGVDDMRRIDWKASAKRGELIVREFRQDEILRVVLLVDRAPHMAQYPDPWLSKPTVIVRAGQMIVDSARHARCLVGYLDYANWTDDRTAFWRPPNQETETERVRDRNIPYPNFRAPEDNLTMALEWLLACGAQVPKETLVFALSDFLFPLEPSLLEEAVAYFDLVPVVIQDPLLEASFPVWKGKMPAWIPVVGDSGSVTNGSNAQRYRRTHQERLRAISGSFRELGQEPVVLTSDKPETICSAFLKWSTLRIEGRR